MTVHTIHEGLGRAVSIATVYNHLAKLLETNEIQRHRNKGERNYYYWRPTPRPANSKVPYINIKGTMYDLPKVLKDNLGKMKPNENNARYTYIATLLPLIGAARESTGGQDKAYVKAISAAQDLMRERIVTMNSVIAMYQSLLDDDYMDTVTAYENGSFEAWSALALEDFDMEDLMPEFLELVKTAPSPVDVSFLFE
jgi:predicted transcriptional regulator